MNRTFRLFLLLTALLSAAVLALFLFYFAMTAGAKLDLEKLTKDTACVSIFDGAGNPVPLPAGAQAFDELPPHVWSAFVAVEDKRFFKHHGVDVRRMVKATMKNALSFSFREGASTISQQLIKNTHLSGEKTLRRKCREIRLARMLEHEMSKEEILSCYLNSIYFGHSAFGIADAARLYFGKTPPELAPHESAMLAALIRSPNRYSPFRDPAACLARRNYVLSLMREQGYLTEAEERYAATQPLPEAPGEQLERNAFLDALFEELAHILPDLSSDNVTVYTRYDPALQQRLEGQEAESDAAMLVREHATNAVRAFHSTCGMIRRLPASLIKPLAVYAPALEENLISPATPLLDERVDYGGYAPENYGGTCSGYMSARKALASSVNIPAVKLLNALTPHRAAQYLTRMDLSIPEEDETLALALGGMREGFTLPALADAYATFAKGGTFAKGHFITCVKDERGHILYENREEERPVFSRDVCVLVNDMLTTAVREGTAKKLNTLPFPVCAKTGTGGGAAGNTDAYTIAYTGEDTVCVWLGNRDNSPVQTTGGAKPAAIACDILRAMYAAAPRPLPESDEVCEVALDDEEYTANHRMVLADPLAPAYLARKELFRKSAIPQQTSTRFSHPKIQKPQITVHDGGVTIVLCQTKYYDYVIKRRCGEQTTTIYQGKYRNCICDNSVCAGERYEYSVQPVWQGVCGEEVVLPAVRIPLPADVPDQWWELP